MLNIIMMDTIMLNVIMLNVSMLLLSIIMLSVMSMFQVKLTSLSKLFFQSEMVQGQPGEDIIKPFFRP